MFDFIKKFATKKDVSYLDSKLSNSFQGVKSDTSTLFEWIKYLDKRIQTQQAILEELSKKLDTSSQKDYGADVKNAIDNIQLLNYRLNETINYCNHLSQKTEGLNSRIDKIEKPAPKSFKEKLIRKITKNSKNYVKTIILSLISKYEGLPSIKLREIVVEEQGLCSKSSFYRTLDDLEKSGEVEVQHVDSERIYYPKLIKKA